MKSILISFGLAAALTAGAPSALSAEEMAANVTEARKIIKGFATHLKGELVGAMKAGGPIKALGVCNVKAPEIADKASTGSGWRVARTSLKLRSLANEPDDWERAVLEDFEKKKADGADPKTLEHFEVATYDGKKSFRFMKAIPTGKPCLHCHGGANVKPAVEARLKDLYPDDKARGFKLGDIRGAFTLIKPLE